MGKTYIDTVKYLIKSSFEVDGIVEKPDIVGAIFGQTEGLLGDDLDLRELQKNGRIGRIEVESQLKGGKSFGTIIVPSSLDMVETSILAASLEIVDRVGPCEAKINVQRIEDSRNLKRKQVLDRAKNLLKTLIVEEMPESKELSEMVREDVKVSDVSTYGADKLPCGPDVATNDSIILVEGRADVVNLLKNNIKNVVAIGGANVGRTVAELSKQKEVTAFLDGDRGGDIILRELLNACEIDFVCRAPPGKEVEELARKELIKCLRRKVPVEQVEGYANAMAGRAESERNERLEQQRLGREQRPVQQAPVARLVSRGSVEVQKQEAPVPAQRVEFTPPAKVDVQANENPAVVEPYKKVLKDLEGSLKARILDASMNVVADVPIREIMKTLSETQATHAVVLDGIVTQRLIDLAEEKNVEFLVGIRAGNVTRKPNGTKVVLAE